MTHHPAHVFLPLPADFDFAELQHFLQPRAVPAIERVTDTGYVRSLRLAGRVLTLSTSFRGGRARRKSLEIASRPRRSPKTLKALAHRLFDLDTDLDSFKRQVGRDPMLGPLVSSQPALRLIQYVDPFEGLVRAILGQQVSLAGARTMADRVVRLSAQPAPALGGCDLLAFPTPATVIECGVSGLRAIGLTGAKAASIVTVSEAIETGALDWNALRRAEADDAQARLERLRGIGPWTAAYVRMRVLGDRDAFLPTDLGVVKAFARAAPGSARPTTQAIVARAEAWRPWGSYATLHLWRSLAE